MANEVEVNEQVKIEKKKPTKLEKWFKTLHRLDKIFLRPVFHYEMRGNGTKYNEGAYIFVSNHLSNLDVMYPCMITDRPVHFVAKKEMWESKIGKWFVEKSECIPANRDGTDVKAVMQIMRCLKNGEVVAIFPEGTRNPSYDELLPFKSGAAAIAIKTKTPIVPMAIAYRTRPFKKNYVAYGEPIEFTEYYGKKLTEEEITACDEKIRSIIWQMRVDLLKYVDEKKNKKKCKK